MRKATKNEFHFDISMESSIKTIANLCCDGYDYFGKPARNGNLVVTNLLKSNI